MRNFLLIICLFSQFALADTSKDPKPIPPPNGLVPSALILTGNDNYYSSTTIIADKSRRTLSVWKNTGGNVELLAYHPMDHGKKNGNKFKQGDLRTPEGIYFIQDKKFAKELEYNEYGVMAFTLNYPNHFDHMKRKTGGGIWLHSIPPHKTLKRGSRGCLVLREQQIKEVDKQISLDLKTPVLIFEKVEYINPTELTANRAKIKNWLNKWKTSWQSKNLNKYMDYYSNSFYAQKKNKKAWRKYKKSINRSVASFSVDIKNPVIYKNKDQFIIRFLQSYNSDKLSDFGEKVLYVRMEKNTLRIVNESWTAERKKVLGSLTL